MWLTVTIVVAWLVLAVMLGRRSLRASVATAESVEQHRRAFAALEAAVAAAEHPRARTVPPAPLAGPLRPDRRPGAHLRPALAVLVGVTVTVTGVTVIRAAIAGRPSSGDGDRIAARVPSRPGAAAPATVRAPATRPALTGPQPAPPPSLPAAPAVLDTGREIVVTAGRPTYRVTLTATGPCWIAVTEPAGHAEQRGRTLGPGERTDLEVTGALVARLGNPAALEVRVDDRLVELPVRAGVPRTVRFVGGAP